MSGAVEPLFQAGLNTIPVLGDASQRALFHTPFFLPVFAAPFAAPFIVIALLAVPLAVLETPMFDQRALLIEYSELALKGSVRRRFGCLGGAEAGAQQKQ
ncbi:hypothetical protein GCM10007426_25540 [Alloalcanivorax dieselolei]|nr:hypothetical protein GCM10007426_25540 [Alloalcanivorax dieselolei]